MDGLRRLHIEISLMDYDDFTEKYHGWTTPIVWRNTMDGLGRLHGEIPWMDYDVCTEKYLEWTMTCARRNTMDGLWRVHREIPSREIESERLGPRSRESSFGKTLEFRFLVVLIAFSLFCKLQKSFSNYYLIRDGISLKGCKSYMIMTTFSITRHPVSRQHNLPTK